METNVLLAVFAAVAFSGAVFVRRSRHPESVALGLVIGSSTFVPMVSAPGEGLAALAACGLLWLVLTWRHPYGTARQSKYFWLGIVLLAYMQLARVLGGQASIREWSLLVLGATALLLGSRVKASSLAAMLVPLNFVLGFHLLYSVGELFAGMPPIWPMGNGETSLSARPNFLLTNLPGRVMTSFAHPIPLATFSLAVGIMNGYFILQGRRAYVAPLSGAVAVILMTGTRSAVIAFCASSAILFLSATRIPRVTKVSATFFASILGVIAVLNLGEFLEVLGLGSGFLASNSFQYRNSILGSSLGLFNQNAMRVLFGWGGDREAVFSSGAIGGGEYGVAFFDNQFVAMAAMFGLIGFLLLVAVMVALLVRGGALARSLVIAFVIMSFAFDFLQYLTPALLFCFAIASAHVSDADARTAAGEPHSVVSLPAGFSSRRR